MQNNNTAEFNGILLVDKPTGMTSHDVVDRVRRILKMKKVGHAGTLDPNATGLMIILLGKGTKASQFLMRKKKSYSGQTQLGLKKASYDNEGKPQRDETPEKIDESFILKKIKEFHGDQYQKPPMFSAKKIKGVPLYKHARKGKEVEREDRLVRISEFSLHENRFPHLDFFVSVSKGTYIRSIAHDLGQKLGCGACLTELRRTSIDDFSVENAIKLDDLQNLSVNGVKSRIIPVYKAVPSYVVS